MSNTDELYEKILKALKQQTDELKTSIQHINAQISKEAEITQKKLNKIETNQNQISDRILQLERKVRKNNIIIFGLEIDDQDLLTSTLRKLNLLLDINICEQDINDIYKLNTKNNSPIKIEFVSYLKKKLILTLTKKLKGTNIFINNDLCKIDWEKNQILRNHQKEARNKGYKAQIKKGKLIINDEAYSIDQLAKYNYSDTHSSPENRETHFINSAPSTPTPISRTEKIEKEFAVGTSKILETVVIKNASELETGKLSQKADEKITFKKTRSASNSSSIDTRSSTKSK